MKVIILAAGYGTRLQQDILALLNNEYSHLLNLPKPLLPLGPNDGCHTLVDYWLQSLNNHLFKSNHDRINYNENIYIVTNDHFYTMFVEWANRVHFPVDHVLNDGTVSNDRRMGAIADIQFAIDHIHKHEKFEPNESLMIIGGDTLFSIEFHTCQMRQIALNEGFLSVEKKKQEEEDSNTEKKTDDSKQQLQQQHPVILYYTLDPSVNASEKGILEVEKLSDNNNSKARVIKFLEKPQLHETNSRLASPCFYMLNSESIPLVKKFLDSVSNDTKLRDAPGHFVRYLVESLKAGEGVIAYEIAKRFDVGHLDEYIATNEYWNQMYHQL